MKEIAGLEEKLMLRVMRKQETLARRNDLCRRYSWGSRRQLL